MKHYLVILLLTLSSLTSATAGIFGGNRYGSSRLANKFNCRTAMLSDLQQKQLERIHELLRTDEQLELKKKANECMNQNQTSSFHFYNDLQARLFREGLGKVMRYMAHEPLTAAEKAELWDLCISEIRKLDPYWDFTEGRGAAGEYYYQSRSGVYLIVIASDATVWKMTGDADAMVRRLLQPHIASLEYYSSLNLKMLDEIKPDPTSSP